MAGEENIIRTADNSEFLSYMTANPNQNFITDGYTAKPALSDFTKNPQKREWYDVEYNNLLSIDINLFKWSGFEEIFEDMPEGFIELSLAQGPGVVVYRDDTGIFKIAQASPNGQINAYWWTDEVIAVYPNNQTEIVRVSGENANGVLIIGRPRLYDYDAKYIKKYAELLAENRTSQIVNMAAVRNPLVISGDAQSLADMDKVQAAIAQGQTIISMVRKSNDSLKDIRRDPVEAKALNLEAQPQFNNLSIAHSTIMSEALTFLGVDASGAINKMERTLSSEVDSNNASINLNLQNKLRVREQAAKKLNKMFGLNVSVEPLKVQQPVKQENSEMLKNQLDGGYNNENSETN